MLDEGVPLMLITAKALNGRSGMITPVNNTLPRTIGTPEQKGLHSLKSDLDIVGNVVDLIAVRRDTKEPVSNYIIATEGNPRLLSATTHLGNMIPHSRERPAYTADGKPVINQDTGIQNKVLVDSPRMYFPLREDVKCIIRKAFDALQVNRVSETPHKIMRYPQEEGDYKMGMQNARIKWLMDGLNHTREEAKELAALELEYFFQPEKDMVDSQDPLGSLTQVILYQLKTGSKIDFSSWTKLIHLQPQRTLKINQGKFEMPIINITLK